MWGMSLVRAIHGIPHIKSERRADNGNVPELDGKQMRAIKSDRVREVGKAILRRISAHFLLSVGKL
jgi:hypothetical protein